MPGEKDKVEATAQADTHQDAKQAAIDHSQNRQRDIMEAIKAALVEHPGNTEAAVMAKIRLEMTSMMLETIKTSSCTTGSQQFPHLTGPGRSRSTSSDRLNLRGPSMQQEPWRETVKPSRYITSTTGLEGAPA